MNEIPVVYPTHKIIKRRIEDPNLIEHIKEHNIFRKKVHNQRINIINKYLDKTFPDISPELRKKYEQDYEIDKPFVKQDEEFTTTTEWCEFSEDIKPVINEYYL